MAPKFENEIRRRKDGSIDTDYYMEKGRDARSAQAHKISTSFGQRLVHLFKTRLPTQKARERSAHSH